MNRWLFSLGVLLVGLSLLAHTLPALPRAQAQTDQRCFEETGFCIAGRIREFWEQQGGLPVFGFPTTPQREELVEGQPRQVQWFQRNRLELHPENTPPYDVLLGRVGVTVLEQQGRDWWLFEREEARENCRFFAETWKNVCDPILAAWRINGIEIDGLPGKSEAENLALFGLPVSVLQTETLPDGSQRQVQWFERARFELHPENAPPFNVQLGLLGNEVQTNSPGSPPEPTPVPQEPTPVPQEPTPVPPPPARAGRIAYHTLQNGTFDVYTMNADGSDKVRLTGSNANDFFPAWSPDGNRIAFVSDREGNFEIYIVNADGTGLTRVTNDPARDEQPAWSPDGAFLAFASTREQNGAQNQDIYVTTPDGQSLFRITDHPSEDAFPVWSPDGNRIAYASNREGHYDIYSMDPDGANKERLTDNNANDAYPSWSPNSARIVFASGRASGGEDNNLELYLMNADGSAEARLTEVQGADFAPDWSPDGTAIVFASTRGDNQDIYRLDLNNLAQTRLTDHPARDGAPRWQRLP